MKRTEPGVEPIKMVRSFTADAPFADVVDADVDADNDSIDENFLLAKSRAILIARYLHRCSTNALEVVLMYLK
jgi:hypothetical protein